MKTLNQPMLGTISHGTLRCQDLYTAFADECQRLALFNDSWIIDDTILDDDDHEYWQTEGCQYLIEEMADVLCGAALPYTYFGSHPGDGSDFGYWICFDSIEYDQSTGDLPDTEQVPDDYTGLSIEINDHGNTTIFQHDGHGERSIVWDCV